MAALTPVRIAMLPKGVYSAASAYSFLDVVTYSNRLYCCVVATIAGESPDTAPAKWQLLITNADIADGGTTI